MADVPTRSELIRRLRRIITTKNKTLRKMIKKAGGELDLQYSPKAIQSRFSNPLESKSDEDRWMVAALLAEDDLKLDPPPWEHLSQAERRHTALQVVVYAWSMMDPDAAEGWTLTRFQSLSMAKIQNYKGLTTKGVAAGETGCDYLPALIGALEVVEDELLAKQEQTGRAAAGPAAPPPAAKVEEPDVAAPPTGMEQRNAEGYIIMPLDKTAYVSATALLNEHTPEKIALTARQLRTRLDQCRLTVRQWKPSQQRLSVHLAEWVKHVASLTGRDSEGWATSAEVEQSKAEMRAQKGRRK